jgi:chromosomal replication initiation ATPase DnaA
MRSSQQVLNLPHKPTYEAADFFMSPTNQMAYRWIESWPAWPNHCLILHGPRGCGKTHLAEIWKTLSGATAVPFEELDTRNLDDVCQAHKALVIEDVPAQFNEEILFHLYNSVQQAQGYILLTCDVSPQNWELTLPDLRSRIHGAMWAQIEPADDELLRAMMHKVFSDEQVRVPDQVVDYLLNHHDRSFVALLEAVKRINTHALALKRRITLPLVKEVLNS